MDCIGNGDRRLWNPFLWGGALPGGRGDRRVERGVQSFFFLRGARSWLWGLLIWGSDVADGTWISCMQGTRFATQPLRHSWGPLSLSRDCKRTRGEEGREGDDGERVGEIMGITHLGGPAFPWCPSEDE